MALGRQLTVEYCDCNPDRLTRTSQVEAALLKAAKDSNATIISSSFHQFSPQGVSGVVIIAESHFTIHAWPEHAYAAVDIFTCGHSIDLDLAVASMKASFESGRVEISSDLNRGVFNGHAGTPLKGGGLPISWKQAHEKVRPDGFHASLDIRSDIKGGTPGQGLPEIRDLVQGLFSRMDTPPKGECLLDVTEEGGRPVNCRFTQFARSAQVSGVVDINRSKVFLDILSTDYFDPRDIAEWAVSFLGADHYKLNVSFRD